MAATVLFRLPGGEITGKLTASEELTQLFSQLPISADGNVWGEEIYFELRSPLTPGKKTKDVEVGDIAYWDEGRSICIFFGPTPVSRSSRPEPYVPVYKLGKVLVDERSMTILRSFEQGQKVVLERVDHE